ncbi:MAG: hypothetical protein WAW17_29485 [Rhodococcus sp. (in: high G+C Gram-positive bacteria)]
MTDKRIEITDLGRAVVESGLTVRQAHEIANDCSAEHPCDDCSREIR